MAELINLTNNTPADAEQVMFNFRELEARLGTGGAGGDLTELFGAGRFVFADWNSGAPVPGDGLSVRLATGSKWLIEGHIITIENPNGVILGDVPAAQASVGRLSLDGEPNEDSIRVAWNESAPDASHPRLGLVTADEFGVESISLDEADLIFTQAALRSVFARLAVLEAGVSGGGGAAYTGLAPWLPAPGDARRTDIVVPAMIDSKINAALESLQAGGERESPSETDQIWNWLLAFRRVLGILAPSLLRFLPGGGAQPGLHGTASAPDTEQFDVGGTLPAVPDEREYDSR